MSAITRPNVIAAIVIGGVVGTIVNAIAVALFVNPDMIDLALVPGRYAVAIAVTALVPFLLDLKLGVPSWIAAFVALIAIPSLLAKLVFGAGATWLLVFAFNAVFAAAALAAYLAVEKHWPSGAAKAD